MKRVIAALLLVGHMASAQTFITKTTPAPSDGYLFTKDQELKNRLQLIDLDFYKEAYPTLQNSNKILNDQVDLWRTRAVDATQTLEKHETDTFWRDTLYFLGGCVVTTALAFAVAKASK